MGSARWLGGIALALAALGGAGAADVSHGELDRARAAMAQAAREYRRSLEPLVSLQASAADRAAAAAARQRELVDRGMVSRRDVEEADKAAAAARETLDRTRARAREADAMVAEAEAARLLASLPPPRAGETGPTPPGLVRFGGWADWSLAMAPRNARHATPCWRSHAITASPSGLSGCTATSRASR